MCQCFRQKLLMFELNAHCLGNGMLTRNFLFTSIASEGSPSNRISIRGARQGGRLLNPVTPRRRETLVLLVRRNGESTC
uniref:Uncharacterized protein n=1 Tax=Arundo donax TaxID=35708 RepID=A0A0A9D0S5_ARUDO